jgi:2-dehydropantoate 2-reductase
MDILLFGAGSLGSLLGALLAREHQVTLVGRDPHVRAIREDGLTVDGEIVATTRPDARTTVPDAADLALVTVKAYDTPDAATALAGCQCETVLSLQNGMGNEATLAAELDAQVLAGTCTYGAKRPEPGRITCTGLGTVVLGDREGGVSERAREVGDAFRAAGIATDVNGEMPARLWEKLAINAGINAPTALAGVQNGALAEGPGHDVAEAAAREAVAVARESGVALDPDAVLEQLDSVIDATAANDSSMRQDRLAGSRTEIDAINGYVVEQADSPVPVNETLTALLRTWEHASAE